MICAHDGFASVVGSPDFLPAALCLAEAVSGAGEPGRSSGSTSCSLPHAEANPVLINLWAIWGPSARGLGLLAAADDRPQDAAAHFADALRLAGEWGAPGWALRTIGDWLATGVPVPDRPALVNHGLAARA